MQVEKMIPEIYYSGSRDFSFTGRLYEVALNYMKTGSAIINSNLSSESIDPNLLELLCNTLGFTIKHKYITKDLIYTANIFSYLLKNKGTKYAIEAAIKALLTSQKINKKFDISYDINKNTIDILLPPETVDVILLEDLFEYILPAGTLVVTSYGNVVQETVSEIYFDDDVKYVQATDANVGRIFDTDSSIDTKPVNENIITPQSDYKKALNYLGVIATSDKEGE